MSQIVVHESSDFDFTSTDDELKEEMQFRDLHHSVSQMLKSRSPIDERFINMYRVRKAKQSYVKIGLRGIDLDDQEALSACKASQGSELLATIGKNQVTCENQERLATDMSLVAREIGGSGFDPMMNNTIKI